MTTKIHKSIGEAREAMKEILEDELEELLLMQYKKRKDGYAVELRYEPRGLGLASVDGAPSQHVSSSSLNEPGDEPPEGGGAEELDEVVDLTVTLKIEEFINDTLKVSVQKDPTGFFEKQMALDVRDLSHEDWSSLMHCGRTSIPVVVRIAPIARRDGGKSRSRAVLKEVIIAQRGLF